MKKLTLLITLLIQVFSLFGSEPNYIYLREKNYSAVYSSEKKTALWVYYKLNKGMLTGTTKINKNLFTFKANPQIANSNYRIDYLNSGYDRGHMMSAADNAYDLQGMKESFYYTNVVPQTAELNRGPWLRLEEKERQLAQSSDLQVFCGSYGKKGEIGKDRVVVPIECWKIIISKNIATQIADTLAYLFENSKYVYQNIEGSRMPYKELEYAIGLKIKDMAALDQLPTRALQADYMLSVLQDNIKSSTER